MLGGDGKDYMSKFVKISAAVLVADEPFAIYLWNGKVSPAKKGGTFVGNYEVAPDQFRKYGIILPKGGMIIPDAEPDVLKKQLAEGRGTLQGKRDDAIRIAQAERAKIAEKYLEEVTRLFEKYNNPGFGIVECLHESGNSSWGACTSEIVHGKVYSNVEKKTLLTFGRDAAFLLQREFGPGGLETQVFTTPITEVEKFIKAEADMFPLRQQFAARLESLTEKVNFTNSFAPRDGKMNLLFIAYNGEVSGGLEFYPLQPGLKSAHAVRYSKHWPGTGQYVFSEGDIASLEAFVATREAETKARLENLWCLFRETKGQLASKHEPSWGSSSSDELMEEVFLLDNTRLSAGEHKWLQSRLGEIPVPAGFIRVKNGTNDLLQVPEIPGRNDILVVEGKTGSRRGEWNYGEWFRGHPSECQIDFGHKGTARQISAVTLNGTRIESLTEVSFLLGRYTPEGLAKWALGQDQGRGASAEAQALAEVYRQQLEENPRAGNREMPAHSPKGVEGVRQPAPIQSVSDSNTQGQNGNSGFGLGMGAWDALNGLKL